MTVLINRIRLGAYADSVALMRLSAEIARLEGIEEAAVMIGTPANKEILAAAALLNDDGARATAGDMIVAIRAAAPDLAEAALATAEARLGVSVPGVSGAGAAGAVWRPKTLRAAAAAAPDATLALISTPGDFAAAEARKAVRRGLNAMVFSDNVSIEAERALKLEARDRGVIVMGPDCGTAILHGIPLGFANVVPRGAIGVIGASGTGMQEVTSLIARYGGGVSHAIGVGGRDLSEAVGGVSTLTALDLLDADPATEHVILISKPPSADVSRRVLDRVARSPKRFTICFLGAGPLTPPANARMASTLKSAARAALGLADDEEGEAAPIAARPGRIAGLFSGGTLAAEAQLILLGAGRRVASNAPVPGACLLGGATDADQVVDLGADEFTRGRPHPMIEPAIRAPLLAEACADPGVGVVLADIVLGYGAHHDPAGAFVAALNLSGDARPLVVASVTGTDADPQGRSRQIETLTAAGVVVAPTNVDAAKWAARPPG